MFIYFSQIFVGLPTVHVPLFHLDRKNLRRERHKHTQKNRFDRQWATDIHGYWHLTWGRFAPPRLPIPQKTVLLWQSCQPPSQCSHLCRTYLCIRWKKQKWHKNRASNPREPFLLRGQHQTMGLLSFLDDFADSSGSIRFCTWNLKQGNRTVAKSLKRCASRVASFVTAESAAASAWRDSSSEGTNCLGDIPPVQWLQSMSFFITKWHPRHEQPSSARSNIWQIFCILSPSNDSKTSLLAVLWGCASIFNDLIDTQHKPPENFNFRSETPGIQYSTSNKTICTRDGIFRLDGNHKWSLLRA